MPTRADTTVTSVSVVIPVRNEAAYIEQTLRTLLHQDYPREALEILVVDGMSDDATREIVARLAQADPAVRLLDNPQLWASSGRNIGVRHARGEIIVIVDGHCELQDRQHVTHLVDVFHRTGAHVVGRPQPFMTTRTTCLQQAIAAARSSLLGHHPDSYIYTSRDQFVPAQSVGAAYRREVFDKLGYFDETFDACEDVEFNYRADEAGMSCFLATVATVHYFPRRSLAGLFYQLARYGRGRVRLYRKHRRTFTLKSMAPGFFLAGLLLGAVLSCFSSPVAAVYLTALAAYLLTLLLVSGWIALRARHWCLLPWLPLVFAAIHLGAGWGILQEWFLGAPRSVR